MRMLHSCETVPKIGRTKMGCLHGLLFLLGFTVSFKVCYIICLSSFLFQCFFGCFNTFCFKCSFYLFGFLVQFIYIYIYNIFTFIYEDLHLLLATPCHNVFRRVLLLCSHTPNGYILQMFLWKRTLSRIHIVYIWVCTTAVAY